MSADDNEDYSTDWTYVIREVFCSLDSVRDDLRKPNAVLPTWPDHCKTHNTGDQCLDCDGKGGICEFASFSNNTADFVFSKGHLIAVSPHEYYSKEELKDPKIKAEKEEYELIQKLVLGKNLPKYQKSYKEYCERRENNDSDGKNSSGGES